MEEIIEGCFKLFFGILLVLAVPVVIVIYAIKAVHWVLVRLDAWWVVHGGVVIEIGLALVAVIVVGWIAAICGVRWWERHQVRQQRDRALGQLSELHQQTIRRMDNAAGSGTNQ